MNRRGFLRSFSALAVAAVAGPSLARLSIPDRYDLVKTMQNGMIVDQYFFFDRPIVIQVPKLTIIDCYFEFAGDFGDSPAITVDSQELSMHFCHIDMREVTRAHSAMSYPPRFSYTTMKRELCPSSLSILPQLPNNER